MINAVLYTIHIVISLFLVLVVLLQQGKGADLAVFGGGGTQAAFGARGGANILHRLTVICFVMFILTTLSIGIFQGRGVSVMRGLDAEEVAAEESTSDEASSEGSTSEGSTSEGSASEGSAPEDTAPEESGSP